jgi:hypothetical protein
MSGDSKDAEGAARKGVVVGTVLREKAGWLASALVSSFSRERVVEGRAEAQTKWLANSRVGNLEEVKSREDL